MELHIHLERLILDFFRIISILIVFLPGNIRCDSQYTPAVSNTITLTATNVAIS